MSPCYGLFLSPSGAHSYWIKPISSHKTRLKCFIAFQRASICLCSKCSHTSTWQTEERGGFPQCDCTEELNSHYSARDGYKFCWRFLTRFSSGDGSVFPRRWGREGAARLHRQPAVLSLLKSGVLPTELFPFKLISYVLSASYAGICALKLQIRTVLFW